MQYTGKEIVAKGIVTNYCEEAIQQQGVDVRVDRIFSVFGSGVVPAQGKTQLPEQREVVFDGGRVVLPAGYYEIELMEAVSVPNNATLHFKTRSSLVRCGALVHSGQFDAGFVTPKAGCYLQVIQPIVIEHGARIAQAIVFSSSEVDNTYNGQWQGDKQRR